MASTTVTVSAATGARPGPPPGSRPGWTTGARTERLAIAGLVIAVVVLRVALVRGVHTVAPERSILQDTASYARPARALVEDGDFDREPGSSTPEFVRTPGYPGFIAAIDAVSGNREATLVDVQAAVSGLGVLIAILLARRLAGSAVIGLAVGVALALDPIQTAMPGVIVSETLATTLVALLAYCGVRFAQSAFAPRWGAALGVTLVVATYVRPTTYYFPLVIATLLVIAAVRTPARRQAAWRGGLAVMVPVVVLLGAWDLRNHAQVGSWRFSGIEAVNTYWYRAADVVARRDGISLQDARVALTRRLNGGSIPDADRGGYTHGTPPPAWQDHQGTYYDRAERDGIHILVSEPLLTARQVGRGVYAQLVQSGWGDAFQYLTGSAPPAPVIAVSLILIWSIEALGVAGMVIAVRHPRPDRFAHVFAIAIVAYTIALSAGPEAATGFRFRAPLWPIWCLYAAVAAHHVIRGRRQALAPAKGVPAL